MVEQRSRPARSSSAAARRPRLRRAILIDQLDVFVGVMLARSVGVPLVALGIGVPISYMAWRRYISPSAANKEVGFDRAELDSKALSFKAYDLHVVFGTGLSSREWPANWEDSLLGANAKQALKSLQADQQKVKITAFDGPNGVVMVFPARHLFEFDPATLNVDRIASLLRRYLYPDISSSNGDDLPVPMSIDGMVVMVCSHSARDARCGYCGPILIEQFSRTMKEKNLEGSVVACSHVGGHEFAGNCIVFTATKSDWFGYVTPERVDGILDWCRSDQWPASKILAKTWRGCIGKSLADIEIERAHLQLSQCSNCTGSGNT